MNKIGIFGGTFNPVHRAHVAVAKCFIEKLSLDLLLVIPNNIPPMKNKHRVSGEDRKAMLEIAFNRTEKVIISDIELNREGTSYTRDTVAAVKELYKNSELFLLTGDDWVDSFDRWYDYRFILDNATLVVANRSGKDITAAFDRLEDLSGKRPIALNNEKLEMSSTEFRTAFKTDNLPDGVLDYIREKGLYGI